MGAATQTDRYLKFVVDGIESLPLTGTFQIKAMTITVQSNASTVFIQSDGEQVLGLIANAEEVFLAPFARPARFVNPEISATLAGSDYIVILWLA